VAVASVAELRPNTTQQALVGFGLDEWATPVFHCQHVMLTSLGEAVQNFITCLATIIEGASLAQAALEAANLNRSEASAPTTPPLRPRMVVEIPETGAGEWDRHHNPTGAKVSLTNLFTFTSSDRVAFVPPPLTPLSSKGTCTLQVATEMKAAGWASVAAAHHQHLPLKWSDWGRSNIPSSSSGSNDVSVEPFVWVDGARRSVADLLADDRGRKLRTPRHWKSSQVSSGSRSSKSSSSAGSNSAGSSSSSSSNNNSSSNSNKSNSTSTSNSNRNSNSANGGGLAALTELLLHAGAFASRACATSQRDPTAVPPRPLRIQAGGKFFSPQSFNAALDHVSFLPPPDGRTASNAYATSGAATHCAYLFVRRPFLFKGNRVEVDLTCTPAKTSADLDWPSGQATCSAPVLLEVYAAQVASQALDVGLACVGRAWA
jgi:hypothetical protein